MATRIEDPVGYARQREWHRRRAVLKKIDEASEEGSYARLTPAELHQVARRAMNRARTQARESSDYELMRAVVIADEVLAELESRGTQLQLGLD